MTNLITFEDMLPFGKFSNGVLEIEKSFSVSHTFQKTTGCLILNFMSCYTGENAPKIQFALTAEGQKKPFYESHFYRIGKNLEFTRQSWRVPLVFLRGITLTVNIQIHNGTVLHMKDFAITGDVGAKDWCCGVRHNAHLGF